MFDNLRAVEFSFHVTLENDHSNVPETGIEDAAVQKIANGIKYLLLPWHARGLVRITRRLY